MTPRAARTSPEDRALQNSHKKSTQRQRLLAGMVTIANRDGYTGMNVSKVIAEAGVSRPTFYEYFADKDDCFLATLDEIQQQLLLEIRQEIAENRPQQALCASLMALARFAATQPARALFLMSQAMASGPLALDARDAGIAEIERRINQAYTHVPSSTPVPQISPRIVIGGVYRLLASRLRRGEPAIGRLGEQLVSWVESYEQPVARLRWRAMKPAAVGSAPAGLTLSGLAAPHPLGRGRPGVSKEDVEANHRARILYAAAQLAERKGYNATTIADITRLAGVDGRTFYAAFADKQDAFMAVHEIGVQQVMSATAGAFFIDGSWPERLWEAGRALTWFLDSNPMIAYVGFVEAYAVGPGAVQRVEDSHVTFTVFLQEGYQQKPRRTPPSRLALEAIITSIFELVYHEIRASKEPHVAGMLGHMAFLALAPFLGAEQANRSIDERLRTVTSGQAG